MRLLWRAKLESMQGHLVVRQSGQSLDSLDFDVSRAFNRSRGFGIFGGQSSEPRGLGFRIHSSEEPL